MSLRQQAGHVSVDTATNGPHLVSGQQVAGPSGHLQSTATEAISPNSRSEALACDEVDQLSNVGTHSAPSSSVARATAILHEAGFSFASNTSTTTAVSLTLTASNDQVSRTEVASAPRAAQPVRPPVDANANVKNAVETSLTQMTDMSTDPDAVQLCHATNIFDLEDDVFSPPPATVGSLSAGNDTTCLSRVMARLHHSAQSHGYTDTHSAQPAVMADSLFLPGSTGPEPRVSPSACEPPSDPSSLMTSIDDDLIRLIASKPFKKQARNLLSEELYSPDSPSAHLASCAHSLSTVTHEEAASRITDTDDALSVDSASVEPALMSPLDRHARDAGLEYTGAPIPDNEGVRIDQLCSLNILDSEPEARYDSITTPLAEIFKVPFVLVSLVDSERQWFKSVVGLPGVTETNRQSSFCAWTLLPRSPEVLVVMDATRDARFRANQLVTGPPHIKFYAGAPLVLSNGHRLGSLCVIDRSPRWFTAEDCNLLCNFAELTVREIERNRAQMRRNFGDDAVPDDCGRSQHAWLVGHMLVHIEDSRWTVKYLNSRASEILGTSQTALVGQDFWDTFSLKGGDSGAPGERFADYIEEHMDVHFTAKAFTDEGRKIWVDLTFRSGTMSQLDDDMPLVAIPMDLDSEESCKSGYWFATVSMAKTAAGAAAPASLPHGSASSIAAGRAAAPQATSIARLLNLTSTPADVKDGDGLLSESSGILRTSSNRRCTISDHDAQLPQGLHLRHIVARSALGAVRMGVLHGDRVLVQAVPVGDGSSSAALRAALLSDSAAELQAAVLPTATVLESGGYMFAIKRLPHKCICSLRTAIHENYFKKAQSADDLYRGVVALDDSKVLPVAAGVAHALAALHQHNVFHGDVSDANVLLLSQTPASGVAAEAAVPVLFSTGARQQRAAGQEQGFDDVAAVREDYCMFVAPERVTNGGELLPGAGAADVWSLGVLLVYLYRFSLPVMTHGPRSLLRIAQEGKLASQILDVDTLPASENYRKLVRTCLDPDPAARPAMTDVCAALQSMRPSTA